MSAMDDSLFGSESSSSSGDSGAEREAASRRDAYVAMASARHEVAAADAAAAGRPAEGSEGDEGAAADAAVVGGQGDTSGRARVGTMMCGTPMSTHAVPPPASSPLFPAIPVRYLSPALQIVQNLPLGGGRGYVAASDMSPGTHARA